MPPDEIRFAARESPLIRVRDALAWRLHRLLGDRIVYGALVEGARYWRRLLKKPIFIGVMGSAGKTTATKLLLGTLSQNGPALGNREAFNNTEEIAKAILKLRPAHRFFVSEITEGFPGTRDKPLALLQPSIGIVTVIGDDHWTRFKSRDAISAEVAKLVAFLPSTGTAVLNADDELVLAMASSCKGKVITYGRSAKADIRADDVSAAWPDRLEMTVALGSERVRVRTQLCGLHWVPSVLGAIGGGIAAGLTLDQCAEGIANISPFEARMQPVRTSDGVTFIRDEYKAPVWTLDTCFEFMETARAKRKIIVIGTVSDFHTAIENTYRKLARRAQEIADFTIFVGPWASSVLKVRKPGQEDTLRAFSHVRHASDYINSIARDGDLVLLKGMNAQDHLLRIILARTADIACWRDDCMRRIFCNQCGDRTNASGPPSAPQPVAKPAPMSPAESSDGRGTDRDEQVIVGLGNPDPKYAGTPHNMGREVVDALAVSFGLSWDTHPDAWIARGIAHDRKVCLVKLRVGMNHSGEGLKMLAERMSFRPEQCILIHDDLDLQLGSVRVRTNGGAGGHRGVASILEAFQTDAFGRLKVGVGLPAAKLNKMDYVITVFAEENRPAVDRAIVDAQARVVEWVARGAKKRLSSAV